jgi:hypothetical protein
MIVLLRFESKKCFISYLLEPTSHIFYKNFITKNELQNDLYFKTIVKILLK